MPASYWKRNAEHCQGRNDSHELLTPSLILPLV
jgi:hypothetical protein